MSRFNLKKFKPDSMDVEGRDSTKLAVWILEQDPAATYQEAYDAAQQLGLGFSGRSWGSARQLLGLKAATPKGKAKKRGRKKRGRPAKAAVTKRTRSSAPPRGSSPIDVALQRVDAAERELAQLRKSLEAMRAALLGG